MAGNTKKKKTANKKTTTKTTTNKKTKSLKLKETTKKTKPVAEVKDTKKGENKSSKKPVSKTNTTSKIKTSNKATTKKTPKNEIKTKNNKKTVSNKKNTKTKQVKPKDTKVKKQPKEVVKEIKEDKTNVESNISKELKLIKNNIIKTYSTLKKKFKSLSKNVKIIICCGLVCLLIVLIELLIFINYKNSNSNTVYHDSYNAIAVGEDSLVIAGSSDFKYSKDNSYSKNSRGKLIKFDEMGNLVFEVKYEGGISTTFNDVIEVSDGYIAVGTGIFSEEEKKNEGREAFIVKFSKDGKVIWEKFYQVLTNTGYNKVIEVSDGYIAIGQSIYANMEIGNHTTGGGIIVKYDKDGNEVWHNNHGGTKSGSFNDLVVYDGNIYVVGKDGADSGNLVKFNSDGEYQWHKNYSYTDNNGLTGLTKLGDSLYAVGSKKVFDKEVTDDDDRYTTNTDALLIKFDLDGNVVYEKTFGGSSYERYNKIIAFHNNFYVVGHICSHDAGLKVTTDKDDEMTGLIVRYDANGNILKKETFGGSNNDNLTDIGTDSTSFYIVGYSNSEDGNMTSGKVNGKDYFGKLLKLNSRFKKMFDK